MLVRLRAAQTGMVKENRGVGGIEIPHGQGDKGLDAVATGIARLSRQILHQRRVVRRCQFR
ncbi:MAG: hypothetical protein BWX80_04084 [Candidatus Hydrogenedentes bacterium ADurb.Bin101]|nr:MAG: hypothetical protein BWX80_04084 [Candidatus Hydrogenedentes bacterium ADurb.Bin101]